MSKQIVTKQKQTSLEEVLIQGNLAGLNDSQRLDYVKRICKATGISLLMRPFDYITLNGKLVLYANRAAAEQLRKLHKISITITSRERVDGLYVVTAKARMGKGGREDESIGAVNIKGLGGQALADALLKAETKAKRRVTLSLCGLGMLDEIEMKDIAERETKEEAQEAIAETQSKIETEQRPEFESHAEPVDSKPEEESEYILQCGKLKGKYVSKVPKKRLQDWLASYNKSKAEGEQLSAAVDDDAFHIKAFLDTPPDVPT